jgi:large subunit ribosomal protein L7Ae
MPSSLSAHERPFRPSPNQKAKAAGQKPAEAQKPFYVQYGMNHVTSLIEGKKAKMVCIASDVNPLELVIWMPALCRKMDVPYCIVKNKSRLGALVGKKTATCVAITGVKKADAAKLASLQDLCKSSFNDNSDALKTWGGGRMGLKTTRRLAIRQRQLDAEAAKKAQY